MLDDNLAYALKNNIPVLMVVAVIGSTEESSVDDIDTILTIRDKYAKLVKMLLFQCIFKTGLEKGTARS